MDIPSLENCLEGAKITGEILAYASLGVGTILSLSIGSFKLIDRQWLVNENMQAYRDGHLNTRPNIFNIGKITNPATADKYRTNPNHNNL